MIATELTQEMGQRCQVLKERSLLNGELTLPCPEIETKLAFGAVSPVPAITQTLYQISGKYQASLIVKPFEI